MCSLRYNIQETMLITVMHLLVMILLLTAGVLSGILSTQAAGLNEGLSIVVGMFMAILLLALSGWPVFKLLSLRPLTLPACTACGQRHVNYHIPRDAWPDPVIICVFCSKPLRLALSKGAASKPSELPTVAPRWPGFLGLWKHVSIHQANPGVKRPE